MVPLDIRVSLSTRGALTRIINFRSTAFGSENRDFARRDASSSGGTVEKDTVVYKTWRKQMRV